MKNTIYLSTPSLTLLLLVTLLLCTFSFQDDGNSLSTVENKIINKITNLLLSQLEARSIDLSIPQLMKNITPTVPYSSTSYQSGATYVCGTPSQFYDRIKLANLEHLVGYLRDANGNLIGHWSSTYRCYLNLQNTDSCIYPMGTFFTNCASNSLLTLLPTRNMFYHLSLVSTLKSDLIQMLLQEKRLFILSQHLETIVIWGRDAGMDADMFADKVLAFKLELRSLQTIFNEIVKRYRDALNQYVNQFDIYYNLNEDTSLAFSKLKTFINSGRYNLVNSTLTFTYNSKSCFHTLKNDVISEGAGGKTFDLVASFCGSIEFIDRHNSIVSQLMEIVENKFTLNGQVTEQLATLFIQGDAIIQESEFDFLNEFYQETISYFTMPDPQLTISFGYSLSSNSQNASKTLVLTPDAIEVQIYDPTLKNKPGSIFHSDSQLQTSTFDVIQAINSLSWTRDSNIEGDYKNIFNSLITTESSSRSINSILINQPSTNSFTINGKTSKLRTSRTTTTYNCEKGRYGPNCKLCSPGNYSPGDGLLYVCNNGPINQVIYTQSGESSENCAFKCKDGKRYRVGNSCQPIPIGYYSKDSGGEVLAPCTLKGNSFGILDESLQQEHLTIISSGNQGSENSCQVALKKLLSIPNVYTKHSFESSFTISMHLKLADFNQFDFILKNYKIGYGIVSFSDWIFQMNLDSFSAASPYKSVYMQVKKINSTETFLISTSFAHDTDWHLFTLQYDELNKILTLFRDNSVIGTCYFSLSQSSSSSLVIGGLVNFLSPTPTMFFPGMISNFKLYNSLLGNQILNQNYFTPQTCSFETSVLYGNGKCLTLSCPDSKMIQEPSTSTCLCPFGRFFNKDTSKCQACPMETTTGSLLPRKSIKDCQCLPDYIYSTKYETCVLAKSSLSPPSAEFHFFNSMGSYKELESTILSQMYYPVGEMKISFSPIEFQFDEFHNNETSPMDYVYNIKLVFNQTKVVWSYAMNLEELKQFTYQANITGDYDLSMSTDCDGHRAGLLSKITFHIRERDLQPLIKPKPTDHQFDSPFQLRLLQPYKTKTSIVILCYGREESNMTCLEYDEKQLYIFGPPLHVKTFSYGPNFQRLPGPIISYYYERTYSEAQLSFIEKQKVFNENLAKKQENLKENEEKKKASVLYQVFNPFVEWFLTYPNYLWFPIVSGVVAIGYVVLLVVIRFCVARRINRKRKEKVKQYLKEKKDMEEYLKQFLPPPLREKGFDDADELLDSENNSSERSGSETDESDSNNEETSDESGSEEDDSYEDDSSNNDSSDSESKPLSKKRNESNVPKREARITIVENAVRNIPEKKTLPSRPTLARFKEESFNNQVDVKLQNIGASRNRLNGRNVIGNKPLPSLPQSSSESSSRNNQMKTERVSNSDIIEEETPTHSNRNIVRKKPLPKPQPKKENQGPKYLLCGDCGGIARFWCKSCSKYMCIQCNQKDNSQLHETSKSKVMVCDYCLQPRSELREVFLKGNSQMKMYACKLCLEELYEDRKVNRVGSVLKRCTKCMDEEISKNQPEKKMCDNCIYFN
ncbi:predicted protein [Naegleria gruberi]|uniref:Predicted protein n=1 Tax=Naegleria gruberi TaxID=5762 RepID=D2V553_NAEGR|nr:uncharacterized protein NAEGRDRAFT_64018 [Naegleria gruberi]EFC48214.1 predicted protein [Naegleria gruberi]|eukprot:XP_002680958.1 predicted protein [Naegleria gruberi strain NEG-M]